MVCENCSKVKFNCPCCEFTIKEGEATVNMPRPVYTEIWYKIHNKESLRTLDQNDKVVILYYDKDINAIYFMKIRDDTQENVRHYLITE
jgi:hypothetical protein